ncbi:hypothetical protein LDVICp102 [lymphocystis disease virus-China]|uniref:Uncharacterized protein n=1 Tax=lymphocystis disease virus-China TaxID=256729 RepID=Q678B0_9VIRU|nr:hypothetical protein LDVICp102 [lymphocystis disease virus-China]AAU10947.1 hypothetical protein [lymphocystis disease virus-China]
MNPPDPREGGIDIKLIIKVELVVVTSGGISLPQNLPKDLSSIPSNNSTYSSLQLSERSICLKITPIVVELSVIMTAYVQLVDTLKLLAIIITLSENPPSPPQ